ncbi:hypothetical protein VPH35_082331 [Triticum aestivum]
MSSASSPRFLSAPASSLRARTSPTAWWERPRPRARSTHRLRAAPPPAWSVAGSVHNPATRPLAGSARNPVGRLAAPARLRLPCSVLHARVALLRCRRPRPLSHTCGSVQRPRLPYELDHPEH